jgi:hypothetical protein
MCEVCKAEGLDSKFKNGDKNLSNKNALYKVFKNTVANIRLCHIHSIELFMMGESRFLKDHLTFARDLARKSSRVEQDSSSPFGF